LYETIITFPLVMVVCAIVIVANGTGIYAVVAFLFHQFWL